jgi:hypothetical protein
MDAADAEVSPEAEAAAATMDAADTEASPASAEGATEAPDGESGDGLLGGAIGVDAADAEPTAERGGAEAPAEETPEEATAG